MAWLEVVRSTLTPYNRKEFHSPVIAALPPPVVLRHIADSSLSNRPATRGMSVEMAMLGCIARIPRAMQVRSAVAAVIIRQRPQACGNGTGDGGRHASDVFHRAANVGLPVRYRAGYRAYRPDVLEQGLRFCRRPAPL